MCEPECECWEGRPKVSPILEFPGAEKTGRQLSVNVACLGQCLGDGKISHPSLAIQPESVSVLLTSGNRAFLYMRL